VSWALVGTPIKAAGANTFTSGTYDTTGADFLVIVLTENTAGSVTLSDNKSNTWLVSPPTERSVVNPACVIYYATASGKTGTGHTFTATGSSIFAVLSVFAFSGGAQSSAFDQENGTGGGSFTNMAAPGSVTPTTDNQLVLSGFGWNSATTITSVTGATAFQQTDFAGGTNYGGGGAYQIQTTATAVNMAWNFSGTTAGDIVTATFFSAGAGPVTDSQLGMKAPVVGRRPAPWRPGVAR
jgi:hypothetical protein